MKLWPSALAAGLAAQLFAAEKVAEGNFGADVKRPPASKVETKPEGKKESKRAYPFHGFFEAGAADGSSFTLKGKAKPRKIVISSESRITRDGRKAALSDAVAGERVTGTVFRNEEGAEQARTVRLGVPEKTKSQE